MPNNARGVRKRLLGLFPKATIQSFPQVHQGMTKAEGIDAVVETVGLDTVRDFVVRRFGRLHQHVYIFERRSARGSLETTTPFGKAPFRAEGTTGGERHHFYLLDLIYELVLDAPLDRSEVRFLWPVKIVTGESHVRVHLTIMAKDLKAYTPEGRPVIRSSPKPNRRELLTGFPASLGLDTGGPLDINRGVKTLWEADEFDAVTVHSKRSRSTSREVMDEEFTVKQDDPTLYAGLWARPLYHASFKLNPSLACIKRFVAKPTRGILEFRQYSLSDECVDDVARRILAANT